MKDTCHHGNGKTSWQGSCCNSASASEDTEQHCRSKTVGHGIRLPVGILVLLLAEQPWASDFVSPDISLTFPKASLTKSASTGCREEPWRTIGKTLIDFT